MKELIEKIGKGTRKKTVKVLAGIVAFATAYSLILPAITIDEETAQEEPGIVLNESGETQEMATYEEPVEETVTEETPPVQEETQEPEPAVETVQDPAEEIKEETVQEETKPAEVAETKQDEVPDPIAGKLEYEAKDDYKVTIEYTEEAGFTEEVTLDVKETIKADEYTNLLVKVQKEFDEEIIQARFFENTIIKGKATVSYEPEKMEINGNQEIRILVQDKEGKYHAIAKDKASVKEEEKKIKEIIFKTEDLDDFTIIVIEKKAEQAEAPAEVAEEPEVVEEASSMPEVSFTKAAGDVIVSVTAPEGAFPEGTKMEVELVDETPYLDAITDMIEEGQEVRTAKAVDIRFIYNGEEIEPEKEIQVALISNLIKKEEDTKVIHIDDEGSAKVVDIEQQTQTYIEEPNNPSKTESVETLTFTSDEFSVYVIIGTETISTQYITAKGDTYNITVTYGPEAGIPKGAMLSVTEFDKDSEEFKNAESYLKSESEDLDNNELNDDEEESAEFIENEDPEYDIIDISILDKNGEKIEPVDTVSVKIEMVTLPEEESPESISEKFIVKHLVETEQGIEVETVLSGGAEVTEEQTVVAEFWVESFSSFVIDWTQNSTNYIDITVYYVNQNGTQIQGPQTTQINITANSNNINLKTYSYNGTRIAPNTITAGGKTYTFGEARYGAYDGDTMQWIQTRVVSGTRYIFFRSGDQHDTWANPSTTALFEAPESNQRYYWTSIDMIATTSRKTAKVYLVYTDNPNGTNPGGSSGSSGNTQNPLGTPEHNKTLTKNYINGKWDGTYTLSLDVKGAVDESTQKNNADVLIILDTSSSMRGQKWTDAKEIIRTAAQTLFSNNTGGNTRVRIALETFNNTAWKENSGNFYTTYNSFKNGLDGLTESHTPGSSGVRFTNWEQALKVANDYTSKIRSNAEPYVIFVSDGNPTVRETKGSYPGQAPDVGTSYDHNNNYDATKNRWGYGVDYGTKPAATTIRCYTWARPYARQLVTSGWNFYAIGAWTDQMLRMTDLVDFAYTGFDDLSAPAGHAFNASNTTAVQQTFNNLVHEISKNFGYTGVKIIDELSISASTALDITGHATDFRYYKNGAVWSGAPAATYDENSRTINWDLSRIGELDNSTTYTVAFTVWPNQDAYDAMLELNQGVPLATVKQHYPSIADYITTESGSYVFQANKNAELKFKKITTINDVTTIGPEQTAKYTFPTMETLQHTMTVSKVWRDNLYITNRLQSVTFQVYEDNVAYGDPFTLSESNGWAKTISISPGIVSHQVLSDGTRLNNGHVYTVRETAYTDSDGQSHVISQEDEGDYHYEFNPENVTPMLQDGVMTYVGDENQDGYLSGINTMRGSVTITKKVENQSGTEITPSEPFTIKVYLKDKNGNDITGKTLNDADAITYRTSADNFEGTNYVINNGDTVTLKAGEAIRLINVPIGVQYKIEEVTTGMPVGYEYVSTAYTYTDSGHTGTTQSPKANGYYETVGNTFHYVVVKNKFNYTRISIRKVDAANTNNTLQGAKFLLCSDTNKTAAFDLEGNAFTEKTIVNDGSVTFDKIVDGTYYLIETESPNGFYIADPIPVTVSNGIVTYDQTANSLSQSGVGVTFSETDNMFTLVITNSSGAELPETGGIGTLHYTLGGLILIMTALMYGFRMRRRERRLDN